METQQTTLFEDGGSIPTSPHQLRFKKISRKHALRFLIKHHYLHRSAPVSYAFGAFYNDKLIGALTIGKPASITLIRGVAGKQNEKNVYELNRLCLLDLAPKNSESRFIGWVLRTLPQNLILVSYADTKYSHIGCVYQATGWIYTGCSIPFVDKTIKGLDHRSIPKNQRVDNPKLISVVRSKKHRYVKFLNGDSKNLLWKNLPYPRK